jgi:SAM-dependent methyltransferase
MFPQQADLHWCGDCKLYSSDIPPDLSMYDKSYCVKYQRYERSGLNETLQRIRYDTIKAIVSGGKLLDFGCGSGAFVNFANQNGFSARGFDINPYGGFTDIGVLFHKYDVVTFWDVLEHLENPLDVLRGIDARYIFACTPNADLEVQQNITEWHHYYPSEHVHYFNYRSLKKLFLAAGYEPKIQHFKESLIRTNAGPTGILTMGGKYHGKSNEER